jgi:predicted enzyme related to lactoylglutathione lyase
VNSPAYFEIQADQPDRAVRFYSQLFGWRFDKADGLPVDYWRIETEGIRGGLLKRPAPAPASRSGTNAFVCSMEVRDIDEIARRIAAAGGQVALSKFAVPGVCWQAYFVDPDGNTFGVFQPDPAAR